MPPADPTIANDNIRDAKPTRFAWDVYRAANRARCVGRVEAVTPTPQSTRLGSSA